MSTTTKTVGDSGRVDRVRVTVPVGPYATVRAIKRSGLPTPCHAGIIHETASHYVYEVWSAKKEEATS